MDPEDDVRAILTGVAGGPQPPMRLDAADLIERGGRVRRRRKRFAVAGTSAATAVVLAVAGFLAGHRAGPPEPVQPAGPGLSTVGTTSPVPSSPPSPSEVPATSIAPPSAAPGRTTSRTARSSVPQVPSTGRPGTRPTASTVQPSSSSIENAPEPPRATTR
ncbi:hypothetical protein Q5425_19015 [Amycolatopsis sp. A133]|uniref:hypothetical protein n=1 Tax=Amycolatopsis sp. A133 TaxID=3064472 RepID=UPI0027FF17D5|nr:hypothetical protein [Amycolatopsis sp. A133]MDQ7805839.1 hypothetical protein [Amycolatopsis sp. A133]